ncbi:MAG: hypothetical protein GQE15_11780 [Archangiaceae bacterium]|nr:hypothetical protein [Archangiaceae bacterium]
MKRLVAASFALFAVSCATMRVYQLPLTPAEGQAMVPALISASVGQNLESFRGVSGAVTTLEDGTQLSWQNSANEQDFILLINLPGSTPEQEQQARFNSAKVRADQLWQIAMASRSMMMPPPVVVMQPAVTTPVQTTTTTTVTAPGASISIGGAMMPNMSVTVNESAVQTTTTTTGSTSGSATCCINGAGYSCPSAAAVDRCSGAFMRCMQACNFSCEDKCAREAPLDPSGCSRNTTIDASCRR